MCPYPKYKMNARLALFRSQFFKRLFWYIALFTVSEYHLQWL